LPSIDINIHPTKTEVKFDDEHTLYAILRSTIKHSLGQFNIVPAIDFEQNQNLETPYAYKNKEAQLPKVTVDAGFNPFQETAVSKSTSYRKDNSKGNQSWEGLYTGLESEIGKEVAFSSMQFESDTITGSVFDDEKESIDSNTTTFQLRRKYIVTTIKSGMIVIDQSRAHQRVLYENFGGN